MPWPNDFNYSLEHFESNSNYLSASFLGDFGCKGAENKLSFDTYT